MWLKRPFVIFWGILALFGGADAHADTARDLSAGQFTFSESGTRGLMHLGIESGYLITPLTSTLCFGPRMGFDYNIGSGFSVDPAISLGLDGTQFLYSGISAYLRYSMLGQITSHSETLSYRGRQAVEVRSSQRASRRLDVGVGLEELLLNGTQSIYPGTGVGLSLGYTFKIFETDLRLGSRYTMLRANQVNMTAIFLDVSALFDF